MAKITRRTGKTDRLGGIVGAVVLGAFALFGFFIPAPGAADPFGGDFFAPMDGVVTAFKVIWVVVCGAGCAYCAYMALKGEGISKETVDIDSGGDPLIQVQAAPAGERPLDFEEKLRKLEALKADGLISQREYEQKRGQIMNERW